MRPEVYWRHRAQALEVALVNLVAVAADAAERFHRVNEIAGEPRLAGTDEGARLLENAENGGLIVAIDQAQHALGVAPMNRR